MTSEDTPECTALGVLGFCLVALAAAAVLAWTLWALAARCGVLTVGIVVIGMLLARLAVERSARWHQLPEDAPAPEGGAP